MSRVRTIILYCFAILIIVSNCIISIVLEDYIGRESSIYYLNKKIYALEDELIEIDKEFVDRPIAEYSQDTLQKAIDKEYEIIRENNDLIKLVNTQINSPFSYLYLNYKERHKEFNELHKLRARFSLDGIADKERFLTINNNRNSIADDELIYAKFEKSRLDYWDKRSALDAQPPYKSYKELLLSNMYVVWGYIIFNLLSLAVIISLLVHIKKTVNDPNSNKAVGYFLSALVIITSFGPIYGIYRFITY